MGALQKVFPLIVLFIVLGVLAFIGFVVYSIVMDVHSHAKNKMEKKNVVFSKDGMKVGVKEVKAEEYTDKTQSMFVKAWNYSSMPAYKSRFWNQEAEINKPKESRIPFSRSGSSQSRLSRTTSEQPVSRTTSRA